MTRKSPAFAGDFFFYDYGILFFLRLSIKKFMRIALLTIIYALMMLSLSAQKDSLWTGDLKEIAIRPYEPDSVWGSGQLNVADFIFFNDKLLLLVYEKELRWKCQNEGAKTLYSGARCILLDENGKEIAHSDIIDQEVENFDGSFLQGIYIKARNGRLKVVIEDKRIDFFGVADNDFLQYIQPYLDSLGNYVFVSTFDEYYPSFKYALLSPEKGEQKLLCAIEDKFGMELFRSEYKYLDPRQRMEVNQLAMDLKMDKKVIAAYARGFHHSMYFETPYAPAFVTNHSALIFDHYNDSVFEFNNFGEMMNSFHIDYHKSQRNLKWKRKVIFDDVTDRCFTLYSKGASIFICEINLDGSGLGEPTQLFHPYVEEIKVSNGYVYYIYRPFESTQKRYLYREPIFRGSLD
jgi:hypothetical protein